MTDKDFEVTVQVHNGRLKAAMRRAGYSAYSLSAASGISTTTIYKLLQMKESGFLKNSDRGWRGPVLRISEFLKCMPEDLIPPSVRHDPMEKTKASFGINEGDIHSLTASLRAVALPASAALDKTEISKVLTEMLCKLKPREERALRLYFGLDGVEGRSLEAVAKELGNSMHDTPLTRERTRQIINSGLRHLRRSDALMPLKEMGLIKRTQREGTYDDDGNYIARTKYDARNLWRELEE